MLEVKLVQKLMRAHKRAHIARDAFRLEEELELATKQGKKSEAQRLTRLLARRSKGVAKRRHNALCTHKPCKAEILETAALPANAGGLSADFVSWEEELEEWMNSESCPESPATLLQMDMNIRMAAESDLKLTVKS